MKNKTDASITNDAPAIARSVTGPQDGIMVVLTIVFVLFYGTALIGWIKPPADDQAIARLEPIIVVIIGYYFGRLPAQQTEQTLKGELNRQTQKAEAAQHAKEQAQQAREALEEKMKNVRVTLASSAAGAAAKAFAGNTEEAAAQNQTDTLRQRVANALELLNS